MASKKIAPLEVTDTGEIPTISVEIPTSYEDLLPDPVPATEHLWYSEWEPIKFESKHEHLFPLVATIIASVVTGAALISIGILIGAGL